MQQRTTSSDRFEHIRKTSMRASTAKHSTDHPKRDQSAHQLINSISRQEQELDRKRKQLAQSELLLHRKRLLQLQIDSLLRERVLIERDIAQSQEHLQLLQRWQLAREESRRRRSEQLNTSDIEFQRLRIANHSLRGSAKSLKQYACNMTQKNLELAHKIKRTTTGRNLRKSTKRNFKSSLMISQTTKGDEVRNSKELLFGSGSFKSIQKSPAEDTSKKQLFFHRRKLEDANSRMRQRFTLLASPQLHRMK